jgi:hypothetical protein
MKAIMIIYNQAHSEKVEYMLDKLGIKGFSLWENVQGRGTTTGVPHLGTHAWPEITKKCLTSPQPLPQEGGAKTLTFCILLPFSLREKGKGDEVILLPPPLYRP